MELQSSLRGVLMKVLVTVASKHGSTYEIAETICAELRACQVDAELKAVSTVSSLSGYDAVILGSAVYAGDWLPQAKSFARKFRSALAQHPLWLFSSGPLGDVHPTPVNDLKKMAAPLDGVPIHDHRVFVGSLDPNRLGFVERVVAKAVKAPEGDFRDWDEIRRWAHGIAIELRQMMPV
jgi:menaquinone-dependent protoporphyrinogen oxidase